MTKNKKSVTTDLPTPAEEQASNLRCRLCDYVTGKRSEWLQHLWGSHGLSEAAYEAHVPGTPLPAFLETMTVERVYGPTPEPTPPEAVRDIRLAAVESNPNFESLQVAPGRPTYNFAKTTWTPVALPDFWRIVGTTDYPSIYPHLTFEVRSEPKKRRRQGSKLE